MDRAVSSILQAAVLSPLLRHGRCHAELISFVNGKCFPSRNQQVKPPWDCEMRNPDFRSFDVFHELGERENCQGCKARQGLESFFLHISYLYSFPSLCRAPFALSFVLRHTSPYFAILRHTSPCFAILRPRFVIVVLSDRRELITKLFGPMIAPGMLRTTLTLFFFIGAKMSDAYWVLSSVHGRVGRSGSVALDC